MSGMGCGGRRSVGREPIATRPKSDDSHRRVQRNYPSNFNVIPPAQSRPKKYFCFSEIQISI
jgi:hypothetical protein